MKPAEAWPVWLPLPLNPWRVEVIGTEHGRGDLVRHPNSHRRAGQALQFRSAGAALRHIDKTEGLTRPAQARTDPDPGT